MSIEENYKKVEEERRQHTQAILKCPSTKIIVVAGPGTGKTFLFQEIVKTQTKCLTLSFVRKLVEDLSLKLKGNSEVKTLHGFALKELKKGKPELEIFPKLSEVIEDDAQILQKKKIKFDKLFHDFKETDPFLNFYKIRKDYYGQYYGFSDIIYALVKFYEKNEKNIPKIGQVIVDEFQDFSLLEVLLIEQLSKKNKILIVGDDDQALYNKKNAFPEHIRVRFTDPSNGYTPFNLPYCCRCPQVIIQTTNDIIEYAKSNGYLHNRIKKPFLYFDCEKKDVISEQNPKIYHKFIPNNQIPWFIFRKIETFSENLKRDFSVLVISPGNKIQTVTRLLKKYGFENIKGGEKKPEGISVYEGMKILLKNKDSNLGWRIVVKSLLKKAEFEKILIQTGNEDPKRFVDLIPKDLKLEVKKTLTILRAIREGREVENEEEAEDEVKALTGLGFSSFDRLKNELRKDLEPKPKVSCDIGLKNISITAATVQGSKGLDADLVFLTHFDDRYHIKDKQKKVPSDHEICKFLVALTRTRKRAYIISSLEQEPTFLKWIKPERIEKI